MWERFGDSLFKVGESDSGRKLKVTMKDYIEYCLFNRDDSPLYLFESNIEEHETCKAMINEYKPPRYLRKDYFVEMVSFDLYLKCLPIIDFLIINSPDYFSYRLTCLLFFLLFHD